MKNVLIAGGANGIGAALVQQYAEQGHAVVVPDIQEGEPIEGVRYIQVDCTDRNAVYAALESVGASYDILVNSVGIRVDETEEGKEAMQRINVGATEVFFALSHNWALPRATFVHVSSDTALRSQPDMQGYCDSKRDAFRIAGQFAALYQIDMRYVFPGPVNTWLFRHDKPDELVADIQPTEPKELVEYIFALVNSDEVSLRCERTEEGQWLYYAEPTVPKIPLFPAEKERARRQARCSK